MINTIFSISLHLKDIKLFKAGYQSTDLYLVAYHQEDV